MALNFSASPSLAKPPLHLPNSARTRTLIKHTSTCRAAAQPEGLTEEEETSFTGSSARTQLDLLEQLTSTSSQTGGYESDGSTRGPTIRDRLRELVPDRDDDFTVPLGKKLKAFSEKSLTISQKRNIKRQDYLNEVSRRNDSRFFATIGAFVILPPIVILAVAISLGYVQLDNLF
ncbi:hypothetical protein QJS04_geneDACA003148 [Acorus gramineus]|uniref:Uncharacterized protein n=1 Tax=Acorus gramineus TaxID=55184 RepID=A0AAV9BSQ5_ACOGR|nr:hypothetical protein QJS04_geneDACA003148 [Acorus gramineus]